MLIQLLYFQMALAFKERPCDIRYKDTRFSGQTLHLYKFRFPGFPIGRDLESSFCPQPVKSHILPRIRYGRENPYLASPTLQQHIVYRLRTRQWCFELIRRTYKQFVEYLDGKRKVFDLPLSLKGTDFQKQVWQALRDIPYGETRSYKQIAVAIGNPKAVRAVGMANNRNPLLIVVPCHRVIGTDGKMVGYAAGMDKKEFLLRLEGSLL